MKKLIPFFIIISLSILTAYENPDLKLMDSAEGSAESIDSEEQYNSLAFRDIKEAPRIKMAPSFYTPGQPWIRSRVSDDPAIGMKLAALAEKWLNENKKTVNINGKNRSIYNDCCHFVRAVYWQVAGIDILYEPIRTGAAKKLKVDMTSGCAIVYSYMKVEENTRTAPRIGDVIFFDDTWDRNRNRRWDDPLTHVGIVTGIADDETVTFIHANTGSPKRIRKAYLNLKHPDDKKRNTYLKARYQWDATPRQLAGQITRTFGGFSFSSSKGDIPEDKKKEYNKTDPWKKEEPSKKENKKEERGILAGTWILKWKSSGGIYSYMFRKTVLKLEEDGSGTLTAGDKESRCSWDAAGKTITIQEGGVQKKYEIKVMTGSELYLTRQEKFNRLIEMMFNKE